MGTRSPLSATQRLAKARGEPDFVTYGTEIPTGARNQRRFSIHARWTTGDFYIEMTDGQSTRVGSFKSRYKGPPVDDRATTMTLVDAHDAYEFARLMAHAWHHRSFPPFP